MAVKRKPATRGLYLVAKDYVTADLDGHGGVSWTAAAVVELDDQLAGWVNDDKPGTLLDYDENRG